MPVVCKHTSTFTLMLVLLVFVQEAGAQPSMENWLARQKEAVASSTTSRPFNRNAWLSRQKAKRGAGQSALQVASGGNPAHDGLAGNGDHAYPASWEAEEDLEARLLSDIEGSLGSAQRIAMENRIVAIEKDMGPMFQAMPKNKYGKLGHPSVRYMLHRFFLQEHGWFIDGLFAEGRSINISSPSQRLKDRVPMFVEGLFEKRTGGQGFGIHEMAVLVALVEDSVHQEANVQLEKTYHALHIPLNISLDDGHVKLVTEVYMSGFVMTTNMSSVAVDDLVRQRNDMSLYYPQWPHAQEFFTHIRQSHMAGKHTLSFPEVFDVVKELVNTFGNFHGRMCQGLKQTLVGLQGHGAAGCVNLPDFYNKGLKGDSDWILQESPEYMQHIGVLDESDPKNLRLLTANYINSPTNCLEPTGYYMVCCHNECDDHLAQLERQLASPIGTPMEILAALKASAPALRGGRFPRLPPGLQRRLEEVAEHHGGRVPIHGRLFAQWLHHVYPNQCPYPHLTGMSDPKHKQAFEEVTGMNSQLTNAEMTAFVHNASKMPPPPKNLSADAGSCAPWEDEEELFAPLPSSYPLHALQDDPHLWYGTCCIAFLAAASTFMIAILRSCKLVKKIQHQPKSADLDFSIL